MALFNMPYICGTRVTQPFTCEGTPFCYCTTSWAFLVATVREIFSVNVPMTRNTKSNAIINIKSKAIMSRPGLNVVSVNFAAITTLLADKIISFIHRVAPSLKWQGKTSTVTFKGIAVFIGGGFFAYINFTHVICPVSYVLYWLPQIWQSFIIGGLRLDQHSLEQYLDISARYFLTLYDWPQTVHCLVICVFFID